MNNKSRLWITVAMLVIMLCALTFGVVSVATSNKGVANTTVFVSGNENVFVEINAKYKGPELPSGTLNTVNYKIDKKTEGAFDDKEIELAKWELGKINLSYNEQEIEMRYSFRNLNAEYPLKVSTSNFAFDSEGRLQTFYEIADSEESFDDERLIKVTSQDQDAIQTMEIPVGTIKYIRIKFKLTKFNKRFEFNNSIKFLFEVETDLNK